MQLAIKLTPSTVTLGTIVIDGKRFNKNLWQSGFYQRQDAGAGYFFDPEALSRHHADLSSLIAMVPSVQMLRDGRGTSVPLGYFSNHTACPLKVFVDGFPANWVSAAGIDAVGQPEDLLGIEVYPRASDIPMAIAAVSGQSQMGALAQVRLKDDSTNMEMGKGQAECGAMMIWTKKYSGMKKKKR